MRDWIVEGFQRAGGVTVLSVEDGPDRSALVFDLMLSVMTGKRWLDRFATVEGLVCYCGAEVGSAELVRGLTGLGLGRGLEVETFHRAVRRNLYWSVPTGGVRIYSTASGPWRAAFLEVARSIPTTVKLFIFDAVVTEAIAAWARELAEATGAGVLLMHRPNGADGWERLVQGHCVIRRTDDPLLYGVFDMKGPDAAMPWFLIEKSSRLVLDTGGLAAGLEPGTISKVRFIYAPVEPGGEEEKSDIEVPQEPEKRTFEEDKGDIEAPPEPEKRTPKLPRVAKKSRTTKRDPSPPPATLDVEAGVIEAVRLKGQVARWGIYTHLRAKGLGLGVKKQDALLQRLVDDGKLIQTPGPRGETAYTLPDA